MTKKEADKMAFALFDEYNTMRDNKYIELKSRGWEPVGLDGPIHPEIKAIDDECHCKIKELAAQIDE